jgi:hypothetical protein
VRGAAGCPRAEHVGAGELSSEHADRAAAGVGSVWTQVPEQEDGVVVVAVVVVAVVVAFGGSLASRLGRLIGRGAVARFLERRAVLGAAEWRWSRGAIGRRGCRG